MPQRFAHSQGQTHGADGNGGEERQTVRRQDADRMSMQALDDVLDDIQSVMESNAQEYVEGFVQKGGQ